MCTFRIPKMLQHTILERPALYFLFQDLFDILAFYSFLEQEAWLHESYIFYLNHYIYILFYFTPNN